MQRLKLNLEGVEIMEDIGAFVGTVFPPYTYTVEKGKIREFALAVGDMKDIYLDPEKAAEAGYRNVTVPPTFGAAIDLWGGQGFMKICEGVVKINLSKLLHGEQEYEYLGDIVAGDVITGAMTLAAFKEKEHMYVLTFETVFVNQNNEEVLKCRQVMLEMK
jgi:acyl dehydratase